MYVRMYKPPTYLTTFLPFLLLRYAGIFRAINIEIFWINGGQIYGKIFAVQNNFTYRTNENTDTIISHRIWLIVKKLFWWKRLIIITEESVLDL